MPLAARGLGCLEKSPQEPVPTFCVRAIPALVESKPGSSFCFDAFSLHEPVPILGSARGHASLENAITASERRDQNSAVTRTSAKIIMQPDFRQATALLDCERIITAMARSFWCRILSPQPPGAIRIGPIRRELNTADRSGPAKAGPFSFASFFCEAFPFREGTHDVRFANRGLRHPRKRVAPLGQQHPGMTILKD
jgi:hypothetical protein